MSASPSGSSPEAVALNRLYTPNYVDTDDVHRVREHHGVTEPFYYKPDIYTAKGIVADSVEEFGLEKPARYVE